MDIILCILYQYIFYDSVCKIGHYQGAVNLLFRKKTRFTVEHREITEVIFKTAESNFDSALLRYFIVGILLVMSFGIL